ncbi:MAG: bifunctional protein-serine/threonine kinase/phosphatase [Opitutaceae bacterium]|nr:bifunctional protein-serine/threonine kinase/phosphatase [Opitutaceae bacterium]
MKVLSTTYGAPRRAGSPSEDAFRVHEGDGRVVAVLADGLGSSKAGGAAARRAVDMLVDYYLARPQAWSPRRALAEFAAQINRVFHLESQLLYGSPELLCTLSAVALEGGRLYGFNVGDSPIYLWRRGALRLLSQAHNVAQPGMEHVLTRAVGLEASVEPAAFECDIEDGDLIVLCSDGVSTALTSDALYALFTRRAAARTLVTAALDVVAEHPELADDTSAIVLEVETRGWSGSGEATRPFEVLPALNTGEHIDGYELVRALQEGERVWLARRADGTRHVLKFPPLEARTDEARADAFIRELWRAARIASPDFVRALTPAEGSLRYYAMEFVDVPTLRESLKKHPLRAEEAAELGRFLLRTGQFLLSRDLVHGDLKPDNILVLGESPARFQLIDFGSAAEVFSVTSRAGTPSYLAPERFHGAALSERTEIFAIGVTLYEALTRTYPYGEVERFQTPRFDNPPKPPSRLNPVIPPWLEAIILRAISPDATHRYQHFSEMAYDLDHPETVVAYARRDAALIERDPLLFYKCMSFALFLVVLVLTALLLRAK